MSKTSVSKRNCVVFLPVDGCNPGVVHKKIYEKDILISNSTWALKWLCVHRYMIHLLVVFQGMQIIC